MKEWREFAKRKEGMIHALDGGLWMHHWHLVDGRPMAHLVSSDKAALLEWGKANGMDPRWIQHHPLKDPRTGVRVEAWHWDLLGARIPPRRL
jgi:hypothetical protein